MENTAKKMTSTDAIVRMVKSINEDKDGDIYKVVHDFAETLAYGGDNRHRIISAIKMKPTRLRKLDELPNNIKNLLIQGKNDEENVFLTDGIKALIETLLSEWQHAEVYRMHNISPRNKILLHGPTGNGKTTIARYIARRSGLAFVEINSDLVIDSHIGGTSGNIYNIINSINEPSVLFWDEVDSIGAKRGGDNRAAGYENDRMVNSILVNLQKLDDNVIFIGATNRMDVLDPAFLRRFDVKLEVPAPTKPELQQYFFQLMDHYNLREQILGMSLDGITSYSDAKLKATELSRNFLLKSLKNAS